MAKLTLHVDEELIAAAKEEAAERKTSVSKLVSDFFRAIKGGSPGGRKEDLPPITSSLVGCIPEGDADREGYVDYLEKKHS